MRLFQNLSIGKRIHLATLATFIGLWVVVILAAQDMYSHLHAGVSTKTQHLVEAAYSVVEHYHDAAKAGTYTEEEAKALAIKTLEGMRYHGKEYFWINDMHPTMIMHPIKPQLNGTDISDLKDPNGKRLFSAMAEVVKKEGAGFVEYMWAKPNETKLYPKVSYVKGFKPWGWIIGSGVYVDEVDANVRDAVQILLVASGCIILLLLIIATLMARSITRPVDGIKAAMQRLIDGDFEHAIVGANRRDEIGEMARAVDVFRLQAIRLKEAEEGARA